MSDPELLTTPLHDLHKELGGKMVPFAGYEMPVQFPDGIMKEHNHTRTQAGLFDVSHMGQVRITGEDAGLKLESIVPVDILGLSENRQVYALFTNESGGILDDLMITNAGDHFHVVVNAACKQDDIPYLARHLGTNCTVEERSDRALLALQGPASAQALGRLSPAPINLVFMTTDWLTLDGVDCFVSRSGYSGEDGFEISVDAQRAESLARALLDQPEVLAVGLGARDSLRLEAGLCLYGHDIDTTTTPIEANLAWSISKSRRPDGSRPGGFPGADVILRQMKDGVNRKRVGIIPDGRAPVREGVELLDLSNKNIGNITSGGFGPTLGGPVAMGYVKTEFSKIDTPLVALVRGKPVPVKVAKMPFVQQRYYRG